MLTSNITRNITRNITSSIILTDGLINPIIDSSLIFNLMAAGNNLSKDELFTVDGSDNISSWNAVNTTTNNATQGTAARQPKYIASGLNGLPTVRFDGIDDYLFSDASILNPGATNFSIFVVGTFNPVTSPNVDHFLSQQNGTGLGRSILYQSTGSNRIDSFLGGVSSVGNTVTYQPQLYNLNNDSGTLEFYTNGVFNETNSVTIENATGNWVIGNNKVFSDALDGDISEIIIYNRKLSDNERTQIEQYLITKWQIETLTLPVVNNLVLNLASFDGNIRKGDIVVNGASPPNISQWLSINDTNNDAIQNTGSLQPAFRANIINGRPAIEFDANDRLVGSGMGITGSGAATIFLVIEPTTSAIVNPQHAFSFGKSTNPTEGARKGLDVEDSASGWRFENGSRLFNEAINQNTAYITTWVSADGAQYNQHDRYINGVLSTQASSNNPTAVPNLANDEYVVGYGRQNNGTFTYQYQGYIGEIIVYDRKLTDDEREQVEEFLSTKWGISLP